jgi:hypothetical protein
VALVERLAQLALLVQKERLVLLVQKERLERRARLVQKALQALQVQQV